MDYIALPSGTLVDREALHVLLDLEMRGFEFRVENTLLKVTHSGVTERDSLREIDRELIKTHKTTLLVVVGEVQERILCHA